MAENKKHQVFISSTYSDLKDERRKILDILLMADCIPAGMEAFVASDVEQFEVIKKVIDLCDYYILIIGKRYGSINEESGLSYTEMEYEYAIEKGIPVLVFALDESVDLPEEKTETEPSKINALKLFRQKALTNRLANIWKTQEELVGAVAIAIMRAKNEIQRPGWQRGTEYDEASLRREIMDLQHEKAKITAELNETKKELISLTEKNDYAFEDCLIKVKYHYYWNKQRKSDTKDVELSEIFGIISTEMLDVSISEYAVENTLNDSLFANISTSCYFSDKQFVKRVLLQLKAVGLVYSKWSKDKSNLFWGLTSKGEQVRDRLILIKKPEHNKNA